MISKFAQQVVRLVLIATVALGLAGAQLVAHAQTVACMGLKADDCQLLDASRQSGIKALTSFNLDYDINFNVTGAPDGDIKFSLKGTGPVDVSAADLSSLSSIATQAGGNNSAAMSKVTDVLAKLIIGTTADIAATSKGKDSKYHVELRLLNNKLYINEATMTQGKWQVVDLKMMAGMFTGMSANLPKATQAAAPAASNADMMKQWQSLTAIDGVLTAERGADVTAGSDKLAAFVIHVDLQKLLSSPEIVPMIKAAQEKSTTSKKMTDDELKASIAQAITATKDLKISFTRYVGVTDKLSHGGSIDITGNADFSAIKAAAPVGGQLGGSVEAAVPSGPVGLDIHLKAVLSGIGQKITLDAPADAVPFGGPPPASK